MSVFTKFIELFIYRGRAATLMPCDISLCMDYVLEHVNWFSNEERQTEYGNQLKLRLIDQ